MEIQESEKAIVNKFMRVALQQARNSTQKYRVGCCIVNKNGEIISYGYNSILFGREHAKAKKAAKKGEENFPLTYRYRFIELAVEAALNKWCDFEGSTVFLTTFPSPYCVKEMKRKGVNRVVHYADFRAELEEENMYELVENMLKEARIVQCPFYISDEDDETRKLREEINLILNEKKRRTHGYENEPMDP